MIKEILVCLEGSASTEAATRIAIEIAREPAAPSWSASPSSTSPTSAPAPPPASAARATSTSATTRWSPTRKKQAADWLALFERRCREAKVAARALEIVGRPADSILAEMENTRPDRDRTRRQLSIRDRSARSQDASKRSCTGHAPGAAGSRDDRARAQQDRVVAYDGSGAAKRAITSFAASGLAQGARRPRRHRRRQRRAAWRWPSRRRAAMLRAAHVPATPHNIVSALSNIDALFKFATELERRADGHGRLRPLPAARSSSPAR